MTYNILCILSLIGYLYMLKNPISQQNQNYFRYKFILSHKKNIVCKTFYLSN